MLTVDLAHISHIKGILITRVALVDIDIGRALFKDTHDEVLGSQSGLQQITPSMIAEFAMVVMEIVVEFSLEIS